MWYYSAIQRIFRPCLFYLVSSMKVYLFRVDSGKVICRYNGMGSSKTIKIFTEQDSFLDNPHEHFSVSSYQDEEPEILKRVEPHQHTYYEIMWVQSGTGVHTIDFTDYDFKGPCLFLIHPQNIHAIKKDVATQGGVVKFTPALFSQNESESDFMLRNSVFDDIDVLPVILLTKAQSEEIGRLFEEIHREYRNKSELTRQILGSYLRIFLLKIYALKKDNLPGEVLKSTDMLRFRSFQQLVESNFKIHHEASFYAEALKLTGKTLGNITRNVSGRPPSELIKERILLEAKRLLHHSSLSVKEIAYHLGFEDSSYFIRFFKLNTKISPLSYKKLFSDN
jgi:AraC family transcriptional activator of pobA